MWASGFTHEYCSPQISMNGLSENRTTCFVISCILSGFSILRAISTNQDKKNAFWFKFDVFGVKRKNLSATRVSSQTRSKTERLNNTLTSIFVFLVICLLIRNLLLMLLNHICGKSYCEIF